MRPFVVGLLLCGGLLVACGGDDDPHRGVDDDALLEIVSTEPALRAGVGELLDGPLPATDEALIVDLGDEIELLRTDLQTLDRDEFQARHGTSAEAKAQQIGRWLALLANDFDHRPVTGDLEHLVGNMTRSWPEASVDLDADDGGAVVDDLADEFAEQLPAGAGGLDVLDDFLAARTEARRPT